MRIFDDDDDDVEPQLKVVDNYYFVEASDDQPVCFSVLPLEFDENNTVHVKKSIYLRGSAVHNPQKVYKQVVAWTVALENDDEHPKISVLSSEGYWIELLKPRKCYGNFARSILTTVQMLHYVRRRPRENMRSLWLHLCEVFIKFGTEPVVDDFRKHHLVIMRCAERDATLMNSKILQSIIEDTPGDNMEAILRNLGTRNPFIVGSESLPRISDNTIRDDDDGAEPVCAICDEGGELLSCKGQCDRAFHPTLESGRKSKCETLGYTSVQVKEISNFLCKNCKYKQHQCFKCGELEPSYGPDAKVFKCCKVYCGHFYHPKCISELLEPDSEGACVLEKKIVAGMPFACPVHWCCAPECEKMEDKTHKTTWLASCRRCPTSYHKGCLPRCSAVYQDSGIKHWFLSKSNLSKRIIFYCKDHDIDIKLGTPSRNHIKFPLSSS